MLEIQKYVDESKGEKINHLIGSLQIEYKVK